MPILKIFFLFLFSFLLIIPTDAQNDLDKKTKKILFKAKKANQEKAYTKALKLYDKAFSRSSDCLDCLLGKVGVYYNQENWLSAKLTLQQVIDINADYNNEIYFSLGLINEKLEIYDEAASAYHLYSENFPLKTKKSRKAQKSFIRCSFIHQAMNNPVPYKAEKWAITTDDSEYWSVMNADMSTIVFTKRTHRQEDLYFTKILEDGSFEEPVPFPWNSKLNEAAHCISPDGKLIIFTKCDDRDSKGGCDLYYTQLEDEKWTKPLNMGKSINSASWDAQPSLSADGKTLYFASKRIGSKGFSDIWVSQLGDDRRWSTPISLSDNINTKNSDESPYLHPDGQTLYFRSNGRVGMGGFDIYYSKKNPITQEWGEAINIGYPINTMGEDGALTVAYDGKTAYYATDYFSKIENRTPNLDIVQFELPIEARSNPVTYARFQIKDINSKVGVKTMIEIYDLTSNDLLIKKSTDKMGRLLVSLPAQKSYLVNINDQLYSFYSENIDLLTNQKETPIEFIIWLDPIQTVPDDKEIVLNNIFFESGSAELKPISKIEIDAFVQYLDNHPSMHITIVGHTDNVGTDNDNTILSIDRAQAVYQLIIAKGIKANRLSYEGKGAIHPIETNDTAYGRSKNRRTSFKIKKQ